MLVLSFDDCNAVSSIPAEGGAGEVLFKAQAFLWWFAFSTDGETVAFLHSTFDDAPSLWSGPLRTPTRIEATRQSFVTELVPAAHMRSDAAFGGSRCCYR